MKNFKITINAKNGYHIKNGKRATFDSDTGELIGHRKLLFLYDGDELVMKAFPMSFEEFLDNMENNEMFGYLEVFRITNGDKFIYARDEEIDEDYLIQIRF